MPTLTGPGESQGIEKGAVLVLEAAPFHTRGGEYVGFYLRFLNLRRKRLRRCFRSSSSS